MGSLEILSSRNSTPQQIIVAMTKLFKSDWLEWEPSTIRAEIREETGSDPDQWEDGVWDKLMATKACVLSGSAWQDWEAFLAIAQAFNGMRSDFIVARVCSPAEVAWAVECMKEIRPEERFEDEVVSFMACILINDGITIAPTVLEFVDDEMEQLQRGKLVSENFRELAKERYELYVAQGKYPDDDDPLSMHTVKMMAIDRYLFILREAARRLDNE